MEIDFNCLTNNQINELKMGYNKIKKETKNN